MSEHSKLFTEAYANAEKLDALASVLTLALGKDDTQLMFTSAAQLRILAELHESDSKMREPTEVRSERA